jgi:hypothetical protein
MGRFKMATSCSGRIVEVTNPYRFRLSRYGRTLGREKNAIAHRTNLMSVVPLILVKFDDKASTISRKIAPNPQERDSAVALALALRSNIASLS